MEVDTQFEDKPAGLAEAADQDHEPIPVWQSLAVNAAGAILGWPHLGPETARAAFFHFAQFLSRPLGVQTQPATSRK